MTVKDLLQYNLRWNRLKKLDVVYDYGYSETMTIKELIHKCEIFNVSAFCDDTISVIRPQGFIEVSDTLTLRQTIDRYFHSLTEIQLVDSITENIIYRGSICYLPSIYFDCIVVKFNICNRIIYIKRERP